LLGVGASLFCAGRAAYRAEPIHAAMYSF
jgi:hypothetical protein